MIKEQEEVIEKLEYYLKNSAYKRENSDFFKKGGWEVVDLEIPKSIETVLNMLKEKDKEINSKNGAINALQCALKERTEERDIIDLMAEYITYCFNEDEGICKKSASRINNQDYDCDNNCKGCIKQYFEKLAKEKGE